MKIRKFSYQVALALVTIMVLSFLYLMLGDQNYSFSQIWHESVVLHLRLPRLLALMFVGILLSSSGLLVQSMTGNPIAEISTLGISGGASFALALLDEGDNGFVINSVHSSEGSYCYTKVIENGECDIALGDEETQAIKIAMKETE